MAANMQPQHAKIANKKGSWGVGRYYFEVKTQSGRYFRIYYDRAPKNISTRKGEWIVLSEFTLGNNKTVNKIHF